MIKCFKHKGLDCFFTQNDIHLLNSQFASKIARILDRLDVSEVVNDMRIPGWSLHALKGNRKDTWSVTVSGNWRITFKFVKGNAYEVNLEDYH